MIEKKINDMLILQDNMNNIISAMWWKNDWDFMRAAAIETSEAIEHHGWKWWKAQTMDRAQLEMEIIDIWHFILSRFLQLSEGNIDEAKNVICLSINRISNKIFFNEESYDLNNMNLLSKLDLLGGLFSAKTISLSVFLSIAENLGLNIDKIYEQYVIKNILNIFRQENGYKNGSYVKIWDGKEDNEVLVEISKTLNSQDENYCHELKKKLQEQYSLIMK